MIGCRTILAVALLGGVLAANSGASAATVTFVSGNGVDSGNCTAAAPCSTLQFAHTKTDAGGTIEVLTSGTYNGLTITRAINIIARGVTALLQTAVADCGGSTAVICVTAGTSDIVRLRGLTVDARHGALRGIAFMSGAGLYVERSRVLRVGSFNPGILFKPAGNAALHVSDTLLAQTGIAIQVSAASGKALSVTIDRTQIENSAGAGILFSGSGTIGGVVRNTVVSGGKTAAFSSSNDKSDMLIEETVVANNDNAIQASSGVLRFSRSTISGTKGGSAVDRVVIPGDTILYPTSKAIGNGEDPNASPLRR